MCNGTDMYQIESENDEILAQEAQKRKRSCSCGVSCFGLMLLLFVILFSCVQPKESGRKLGCGNNENQIMNALHFYNDCYRSLPPAYTIDENGKPLHSWRVLILPFLDQTKLYEQIRLDEPWDSEYNQQFHDKMPKCYWCTSAYWNRSRFSTRDTDTTRMTCYMRVVGAGTTTDGPSAIKFSEIGEDFSEIVALVEVYSTVNWMAPVDVSPEQLAAGIDRKNKQGVGSYHHKGIHVAMLDCPSHFATDTEIPSLAEKVIVSKKTEIEGNP